MDLDGVVDAYWSMKAAAPRRHNRKPPKQYFVGHTGIPSTGAKTNRLEEHLAIAMWSSDASLELEGSRVELLDYQVPMKAYQSDRGIGKVDLFGLLDNGSAVVVELKVAGRSGAISDTPLRACLEALTYAAITEANLEEIGEEIESRFGRQLNRVRPAILIAGPTDYWSQWDKGDPTGQWRSDFCSFVKHLADILDMQMLVWDLGEIGVEPGLNETRPRLLGAPSVKAIC